MLLPFKSGINLLMMGMMKKVSRYLITMMQLEDPERKRLSLSAQSDSSDTYFTPTGYVEKIKKGSFKISQNLYELKKKEREKNEPST